MHPHGIAVSVSQLIADSGKCIHTSPVSYLLVQREWKEGKWQPAGFKRRPAVNLTAALI